MSSNPSQQQQTSPYGGSSIAPQTGFTQPQSFSSFPNGTLIKGSGPEIFIIEKGVRRLIPDMETFNAMGLNLNNIINVDNQKVGTVPLGIPLPTKKSGRIKGNL